MAGGKPATTTSGELEALVVRAASGEVAAQGELLRRYRGFIRAAVRGRLSGALRAREETADLEQEVAVAVLESLRPDMWQGSSAFCAWLGRLVSGSVIDRARYHGAGRRALAREAPVEVAELARVSAPGLESQVAHNDAAAELEAQLEQLPPRQAQAVILRHQGHSHAEIGAILGCTAEAARKHVARGHAALAQLRAGQRRG